MTVTEPEPDRATRSLLPVHESWLPNEHPLHRPRHGIRQRIALVCAVVFFCTPPFLLVVGVRTPSFENRQLAAFPSPAAGWGFMTGLVPWAADHLPLRDRAVGIEDLISRNIFGEPPPFDQQPPTGRQQPPIQGPVAPDVSGDQDRDRVRERGFPKVVEGRDDWLYLGSDVVSACVPDRPPDEVFAALARLRTAVESSGRRFVLIVAPNKSTMVPEHLPGNFVGAKCLNEGRDAFWRRVAREPDLLDLRPKLAADAARIGRPVYSKVDSHWTFEGALGMAIELAARIQPGVTETWLATPGKMLSRAGDLPPLIGRSGDYTVQTYNLAPDGDTIRSRSVDGDFHIPLNLTQQQGTGIVRDPVGMIADSYTLSALPYLAAGFSDISIIHNDPARANPDALGELFADKKVVVLEAVERSLVSGTHPMLDTGAIDAFGAALARHPLR